jgi:hypothetical protein
LYAHILLMLMMMLLLLHRCCCAMLQITYSATAATAAGPSSVPDLDATIAE